MNLVQNLMLRELSLTLENQRLKEENSELNISLMRTKSELSDAEDTIKRWRAELEIVASKGGHNACHIWIPELLKHTIGHTGNFFDQEKLSPEQFAEGCVVFHGDRFPNCGVKLVVVKSSQNKSNV